MTPKQFVKLIQDKATQITRLQNRVLPVKLGHIGKEHFTENFAKGGFVNNGVKKWKDKKRPNGYDTLRSERNHLSTNTNYKTGDGVVTFINDAPYAGVHNYGGVQYIKPHKRTSKKGNRFNVSGYSYLMPKRQFIGESQELKNKATKLIEEELTKILKS